MEYVGKRNKFATILICLMPILDPYVLFQAGSFEIHIVDLLMLICLFLHISSKRYFLCNKDLLIVMLVMFAANLIAFVSPETNSSIGLSLRVWVYWVIYIVLFSTTADNVNRELFFKYILIIAKIATIFLLVQFLMMVIGIPAWDGQLPLPLSKTDGWAQLTDITGSIRVHSFFQEPSYYVMYIMPVLAYCFKIKDIKTTLLLIFGILLSTSSMGIAGIGIIILMWLFFEKRKEIRINHVIVFVLIFVLGVGLFMYAYNKYPQVRFSTEYMISKLLNTRNDLNKAYMGSTKIRLLGNIDLFSGFTVFHKLFGLGINQYPLVYPNVIPYSNSMVTFLLNGGLVVVITYMLYEAKMILRCKGFNMIYAVLFTYVMFTDLCIFTWYAFYLIFWAMLFQDTEYFKQYIKFNVAGQRNV